MRRIIKPKDSEARDLVYKIGGNNSKIRDILLEEQKRICAYTETYLDRTSKKEIEHFNPTLKDTDKDGYDNYFLVKGQWNNEKGGVAKWLKFQPLLRPTHEEFEERVIYIDGTFMCDEVDVEAENLIKYLNLDDEDLTGLRLRYIRRQRKIVNDCYSGDAKAHFLHLLKNQPEEVYFIRAIQEEFDIQIKL